MQVKCKILFPLYSLLSASYEMPLTNVELPQVDDEVCSVFATFEFTNFPGRIFYADRDGGAIIANSWYPFETLVRCDGVHLPIFPDNVFDNG